MNNWTNPQTLAALIGAFTALIVAIGATYHSIVTRGIATSANVNAAQAKTYGSIALKAVSRPVGPPPATPPVGDGK